MDRMKACELYLARYILSSVQALMKLRNSAKVVVSEKTSPFCKMAPTKEVDQEQINQEQPQVEETQIDKEHENVATGKEQLEEKSEDITMNSDKAKDEQVESECGYQKYDYAMERIGIHWRWPTIEDVIWYEEDEIVSRISAPRLINKRGFYSVPEMKDMD
ncbi:hypothetical protein JTB14_014484 [Gonioctena quinquepunctata]|nr:hypothetical protein JTB14_014484 [Gonioctena quinquepunctata]